MAALWPSSLVDQSAGHRRSGRGRWRWRATYAAAGLLAALLPTSLAPDRWGRRRGGARPRALALAVLGIMAIATPLIMRAGEPDRPTAKHSQDPSPPRALTEDHLGGALGAGKVHDFGRRAPPGGHVLPIEGNSAPSGPDADSSPPLVADTFGVPALETAAQDLQELAQFNDDLAGPPGGPAFTPGAGPARGGGGPDGGGAGPSGGGSPGGRPGDPGSPSQPGGPSNPLPGAGPSPGQPPGPPSLPSGPTFTPPGPGPGAGDHPPSLAPPTHWTPLKPPQPQVSAVPEPLTWQIMLLGFGGLGWSLRSKRRHGAQPKPQAS